MFQEKEMSRALTWLVELCAQEDPDLLEPKGEKGGVSLDQLPLPQVCLALRNRVQWVYDFALDSDRWPCFRYRGRDLFGQRGCKVYEELLTSTSTQSAVNHFWELWLLEDMTFVVVENVNFHCPNQGKAHYTGDYRTIKNRVEKLEHLPFEGVEILQELVDMSQDLWQERTVLYAM